MSVFYVTQLEAITQQQYASWEWGGGFFEPLALARFCWVYAHATCGTLILKPFSISRRPHPAKFFFLYFHTLHVLSHERLRIFFQLSPWGHNCRNVVGYLWAYRKIYANHPNTIFFSFTECLWFRRRYNKAI